MAIQSMVGLGGGSITKGRVDLVQNLILNLGVAFLCIGDTQRDLMLQGIVDDAIVSNMA